jgi:hypothetical protein
VIAFRDEDAARATCFLGDTRWTPQAHDTKEGAPRDRFSLQIRDDERIEALAP